MGKGIGVFIPRRHFHLILIVRDAYCSLFVVPQVLTRWQKVGGVHEGRFSTPSVSPPVLGEKN